MGRWAVILVALGLCGADVRAASLYLQVGDGRLRSDLQLLIDAGVIDLTVMSWPLPRADVERALAAARPREDSVFGALLARVRERVGGADELSGVSMVGGHPGLLRDFETPGREDGNFSAWATTGEQNWSATLVVTGVTDAPDRHSLRLDGSELTLHVGNWLLSQNVLDRWWGPGMQNSLILSNNARPIPAITIDRAQSVPFDSRWLHWIGPWRLTTLLGRMEGSRHDVRHPLYWGARVEARPRPWLEVGLQRTSMFCGDGRACGPRAWWDMLAGKYAAQNNVSSERNPGDTLAGFDLRIAVPGRIPLALFTQLIAEDVSRFMPFKFLGQFGLEAAGITAAGGVWRAALEYSDSTCSFYRDNYGASRPPLFGCAYEHHLYNVEGYRYLGGAIGAGTDNDSRLWSGTLRYAPGARGEWTIKFLNGAINRGSDGHNTISAVPMQYRALQLGWKGGLGRFGTLGLQLGGQREQRRGEAEHSSAFGFLDWQYALGPPAK